MNQDELERRLAQIAPGGDTSKLRYQVQRKTRKVPNPAAAPNLPDGSQNPAYVYGSMPEIEQTYEVRSWTNPTTGATIDAEPAGDGTYTITNDDAGTKTPAASTSTKPAIPPGGSSTTEGTPLPGGGWDNNRPRQVIKDKDGNVVWTEELTGADLTAWRAAQQANQPQSGEVRKPVDGRPGWTSITRTTKQGGNETTTTVYVGPDGKEVPTLPAETGTVRVPVDGHPGIYLVTTTTAGPDGKRQGSHYENEAGQKVPQPAAAPTYNVQQREINGQTYTVVTKTPKDGSKPTITNYGPDGKEVAALPTEGRRQLPAGLPALDTSTAKGARESYLAQVKWAQDQVVAGNMSQKEAVDLLTPSHQAAESVIKAEQDQISNERQTRTQNIQQEGNRLNASTAQFANSRLGVDEIAKYAPRGGTHAGTAYLTNLLTQGLMNRTTRGNVGAASPTPSPLPSPNAASELAQPGDPPLEPTGSAMIDRMAQTAQAAAAVGPERAAEIRANPVFRPTAPVGSPVFQNSEGAFGLPDPAPTPPAVQGTPSPLGDTGAPPVGMVDPSTLPPFLQRMYGRSVLESIIGGYAA